MKRLFKSSACRLTEAMLDLIANAHYIELKPGKTEIPEKLMKARQVRLTRPVGEGTHIAARLVRHRGSTVPALSYAVANELVRDGVAQWEPQWLLCYTVADYKADPDVQGDAAELARLDGWADDELVAVAMVGESRSTLAVCRNIVSGCQKPEKLVSEAAAAIKDNEVYLVEG